MAAQSQAGEDVTKPRKIIEELHVKNVIKVAPQTTVFRAFDATREKEVALKLLNPAFGGSSDAACEAFLSFAERLQQLALDGFPAVLDFGFTPDSRAFLETALVPGVALMERAGAEPSTVLRMLAAVARAANSLAEAGLVHHNLSSDNVLVDADDPDRVWLLGLGSAQFLAAEDTGALPGHSPEWETFAAPEHHDPELAGGQLSWPADLYSTALIACQVLGADVGSLGSPAPSVRLPAELRKVLAGAVDLERALSTALRRSPDERTLSLGLLAAAFEGAAASGGAAPVGAEAREEETPEAAPVDAGATVLMEVTPEMVSPPAEGATEQAEHVPAESPPERRGPNDTHPTAEKQPERETAPPTQVIPDPGPADEPTPAVDGGPKAPDRRKAKETPPPPQPVASPVPAPTREAAPGAEQKEAPAPAAKAASVRRRFSVPPVALAVAGGLVVVLAVVLFVLMRGGAGHEEAAQSMPVVVIEPTAPPAAPSPGSSTEEEGAMDPRLVAARSALDQGDAAGARQALAEISPDDEAGLSENERAELDQIRAELEGAGTEQAISQLRSGLRAGRIDALRRAVDTLSGLSSSEVRSRRGLAGQLAKARRVVQADTLMWRAQKAGDHLQVLERAGTLIKLVPKYDGAFKLREEAASALEKEAAAAASRRDFTRAIGLLNAEQRYWPSRQGLAGRLARVKETAAHSRQMEAALQRAASALADNRPEEGLKALGSVRPDSAYAVRFANMTNRLQQQLDEMDAQPPQVSLAEAIRLRYRKNEPLEIPLTVTDDLRVEQVKVMVRTKDRPAYRELTLKPKTTSHYVFDLTPALHQNETVEFYVVATDSSGHTGFLGSPSKPLEVTRKKWYQR